MTFFLEVLCSHFKENKGGLFLRGKNALEISILRKSFFFQEKVIQHSKRIFIKVKPPVVIFSIDEIFDFFLEVLCSHFKENKGGLFLRGKNALEISILRKSFFFQEKVIQHSKRIFIKVKPPVVIFSIDEIFDFFFGGTLLPL